MPFANEQIFSMVTSNVEAETKMNLNRDNESNGIISIEVAYANEQLQKCIPVLLSNGSQVKDAVLASKLWAFFLEFNVETILEAIKDRVGIFSEKVSMDTLLSTGDRVEIYQPLKIDPKESRWLRVKQQRRQTMLAVQRNNIEKKLKKKAHQKKSEIYQDN